MSTLEMDLAHSPRAWLDRPLRVEAVPTRRCVSWVAPRTPPCLRWYAELSDADANRAVRPLPLALGGAPHLLAVLRSVPLVGWWLPARQSPRWGVAAEYRIQLRALPCTEPGWDRCYEAVLLDAAPQSPG